MALTKSTPATDGKVKPLALFKTPQTAAAAAAGEAQGAIGLAAADDPGAGVDKINATCPEKCC